MKKIAIKGIKGKQKEVRGLTRMLAIVYLFGSFFLVFESSFIKMRQAKSNYENNVTLIDVMFQDGKIMLLILILSLIMVSYAIMNISKKRSYSLRIMRGLGADIWEIISLLWWESFYVWRIAIVFGTFFGLGLAVLCLIGINCTTNLSFIMDVPISYFCGFLLFTSGVFFMDSLFVVFQVVEKSLSSSFRKDASILDSTKMPTLKRISKLSFWKYYKRNRMFYFGKTVIRVGLSIVVLVIITVNMQLFAEAQKNYEFIKNQTSNAYKYIANDWEDGLTDDQIHGALKIPGVTLDSKEIYLNANMAGGIIKVSSPKWEKSEYVITQQKYQLTQTGMEMYEKDAGSFALTEIRGVRPEDDKKLSYYQEHLTKGNFNKEAFLAGEECILFLTPYQIRDIGGETINKEVSYLTKEESVLNRKIYHYEDNENSIQPGDRVTVSTPWGETEIVVGGIVTEIPPDGVGSNVVAIGEKFLVNLIGATESIYNCVEFTTTKDADLELVDEELEQYFREVDTENDYFSNERLIFQEIAEGYRQEMMQYMSILCVVLLLYFLVMYQGNTSQLESERTRIGILGALGKDRFAMRTMYMGENLLEGIFVIGSSFLVSGILFLLQLRGETSFDSIEVLILELQNNVDAIEKLLSAFGISVLIFLGVSFVTLYIPLGNVLRKSVIENILEM